MFDLRFSLCERLAAENQASWLMHSLVHSQTQILSSVCPGCVPEQHPQSFRVLLPGELGLLLLE